MQRLSISTPKRIGDFIKAGCRFLCRPILPLLPDQFINRLPFLGRVSIYGPDKSWRLQFHTYGTHGKDRIAIKLARRGLGGYEGETMRVFLALIKETQNIIDIGANTGLFALLAARVQPNSRVLAFEPVPFIFDMLKKNVHLNQLHNLEVSCTAIADFVGESTFYITRTNVGVPTDSSMCQGFRDQVDEYRVPTTTLDEYIKQHSIPSVDLLKIDTESTESKVIGGALEIIQRDQPFIICEVLKNVDHSFIQQTLQAMNYRFYHITPARLHHHTHLIGSLEANERNYVFVPERKHHQFINMCNMAGIQL